MKTKISGEYFSLNMLIYCGATRRRMIRDVFEKCLLD